MEARVKVLAILGLPMTKEEEAEYTLLLANDAEFKNYMESKTKEKNNYGI